MFIKRIISWIGLLVASSLLLAVPAFAQEFPDNIPDKAGLYDVPNHPKLKVRVFVHEPRNLRGATSNALVCNLPDPDSSAVVPPTGWHLPSNWTYQLNPSSVPSSVGSGNLATFASDAFARWKQAANNKINFTQGSNTTTSKKGFDGKNIISWGRTSGSALATTYTWYYPSTGLVAEVDTIMNQRYPWGWTPYSASACVNSNSYDAQDILTHELGHWLGLDDTYSSSFVDNTLYGYGSTGEIKKDTLTSGDISGAQAIYP